MEGNKLKEESTEPHVEESNKEEPIVKVVVYRHPHHT
jgi:hypothetical protein